MLKKLLVALCLLALVTTLGLIQGCGQDENPVATEMSGDEDQLADLSIYNPEDRFENDGGKQDISISASSNCSWWNSLGRSRRNYQIVLEALYSVDKQIWDQNNRVTCQWHKYLSGTWGCYVPGDWNYSNHSNINGYSGECKPFVCEILERASGGAASLPGNTYNYISIYPWRNRSDGIMHAQPGEVMQLTGSRQHTAVIITNFHDGRFEIVDGNYCVGHRIAKHVINVKTGKEKNADLKFYVIDNCF